ncbi:unnamed protein product [Trichogramma brassicae]|uniref:C2H2-type domain-containing protein n=1 Tax=Trichogramma brassicae TaxID=86971 RepID=A0A6H5I2M2_9HYME|nr:unnamed protein product [Trichogramma brassicae]
MRWTRASVYIYDYDDSTARVRFFKSVRTRQMDSTRELRSCTVTGVELRRARDELLKRRPDVAARTATRLKRRGGAPQQQHAESILMRAWGGCDRFQLGYDRVRAAAAAAVASYAAATAAPSFNRISRAVQAVGFDRSPAYTCVESAATCASKTRRRPNRFYLFTTTRRCRILVYEIAASVNILQLPISAGLFLFPSADASARSAPRRPSNWESSTEDGDRIHQRSSSSGGGGSGADIFRPPCHACARGLKATFCGPWAIVVYLKKHINAIHNKSKPFECEICHKSFGQNLNTPGAHL